MKQTKTLFFAVAILMIAVNSEGQEYKLKQSTSVSGMNIESTIYVKGKRKRTEGGGMMGMGENQVTIEQCDLQRYIKLNTKKKLYFIEPFGKEEVIDDDAKAKPAANKPPVTDPKTTKKGGTITMYYSIVDTGERKKMYGFTARHIWTTQKIKPSPDACTMKDSFMMKTDGWYIDLPDWTCPVRYSGTADGGGGGAKPDCQDKFVTRTSGKGKLGFPLIEKRTMFMGDGKGKTTEYITELNTLELTSGKLDSMLFTIPPGYTETKNQEDLNDPFDMNAYVENMKKQQQKNNDNDPNNDVNVVPPTAMGAKPSGSIRVGIYVPTGQGDDIPGTSLQNHMVQVMNSGKVHSIAVTDEADARAKECDYVLNTNFTRVKQASKVGGIIKAIKNTDPNAASSWNIDADMKLTKLDDGSLKTQEAVSGKYSGQAVEAAKNAVSEGGSKILRSIK
jgi:hypothetical protein